MSFKNSDTKSEVSEENEIQFNNTLIEFIEKLRTSLPTEYKSKLNKYYKYYRKHVDQNTRLEFIREFIQYIEKYIEEISTHDEGLFCEEPQYYPGKTIQLLKGFDFKTIWRLECMTDEIKMSVWKYFQTLYIIGTYIMKSDDKFKNIVKKQQDIIDNILQALHNEDKIKQDAKKQDEDEEKASQTGTGFGSGFGSDFNMDSLKDIFGGEKNNLIIELAMEIAKDLDLPKEMTSNPLDVIKTLFGQNGAKLQDVIAKIGTKLKTKMKDSGLSEEQLFSDAKKMNDNLMKKFKNIPGMPDLSKFSSEVSKAFNVDIDGSGLKPNQFGSSTTTREESVTPDASGTHDNFVPKMPELPDLQKLTEEMTKNFAELSGADIEKLNKKIEDMFKKPN
jgi:hypothetical protein